MNAKKCKMLRKLARALTVGKPECQYMWSHDPMTRRPVWIVVAPKTTRGVYRQMKRNAS